MKESFHYLSMAIYSMIHKKIFLNMKDQGLTIGQPKILDYLLHHENATNKEIATACKIEPATLTSVLGRMEKSHLVERKAAKESRRNLSINLTPQGTILANQVEQEFIKIEKEAFKGLSKEEQKTFMNLYKKIYDNMTNDLQEGETWKN